VSDDDAGTVTYTLTGVARFLFVMFVWPVLMWLVMIFLFVAMALGGLLALFGKGQRDVDAAGM